MKQKHLHSLLDTTFTTVRVEFQGGSDYDESGWTDDRGRPKPKPKFNNAPKGYAYKVPKSWDVQPGGKLVVDSHGTLKIVTVLTVDPEPDIDIDAEFDYKWAVCKVNLTEYERLVAQEKTFNDTMLHIERVKQRELLVESFRANLPEGSEARRLFEQTTSSLAPPQPVPMGAPFSGEPFTPPSPPSAGE